MRKAGVELLIDIADSSVMGIVEVIRAIPEFQRKLRLLIAWMEEHRPEVLVCVDFPDFNLRLAAAARELGIPVVYHIPPKAWAWRPKRGKRVAELATAVISIFPFEAAYYEAQGAKVVYVGNPLIDIIRESNPCSREDARARFQMPADVPVLGLLPGSRKKEIESLMTPMLGAARRVREALPDVRTLVPLAPTVSPEWVGDNAVQIVQGDTYNAIRACDAVIAASGTVTLEAAILGVPMVIVYRLSPLTYWLARRLVRVKYMGLPNLLAEREICPELLQDEANPERMAEIALELLSNPQCQKMELERVTEMLGDGGAPERTAEVVLSVARR